MTLRELSKELGVAPSTISRVLNGDTHNFSVSDDLRRKILDHVKKTGYQPNPVFSGLRKQNVQQVSILFYSRSSLGLGYTFEVMVDRAARFFEECGYDISFAFNRQTQQTIKYTLPPWKCSGLLVPDPGDLERLSILDTSGIPYVCMNGSCGPNGTAVIADEQDSMKKILEYLFKLGHRKIVYIAGAPSKRQLSSGTHDITSLRCEQYFRSCSELQISPLMVNVHHGIDPLTYTGADFDFGNGKPVIHYETPDFTVNIMQSGATAVICSDDFVSELLFRANKYDIRIPRDLSIVSYNDLPFMRKSIPAITSFRIPAEEMGSMAAQILLKKMQEDSGYMKNETLRLQGNLILRESTAPPGKKN